MTTRLPAVLVAVLVAVALLVPALGRAQNAADTKRAQDYVQGDADFQKMKDDDVYKHLTPAQQKALDDKIIRYVASRIQGKKDSEIKKIDIIYDSGSTKKELQGEKTDITAGDGKYQVVELKQDVAEVAAHTNFENKPIDLPNLGNLFLDNHSDAGPGKDKIDKLLAETAALIKARGGFVTRILIRASASTLHNTEEAATLTYVQLSENRAKTAQGFIEKAFADGKVTFPDGKPALVDPKDISVKADNGDGTSGPGSPYPCVGSKEFCSAGNDGAFDLACNIDSPMARSQTCSAPPPAPDPAECAWTSADEDPTVDCAQWKTVRALRAKPRFKSIIDPKSKVKTTVDNWTSSEVAAVKSFYAPYKYVEARICAMFKNGSVESTPGEAHMVLALVETEANGTYKFKGKYTASRPKRFKTKKPKGGKMLPCPHF